MTSEEPPIMEGLFGVASLSGMRRNTHSMQRRRSELVYGSGSGLPLPCGCWVAWGN